MSNLVSSGSIEKIEELLVTGNLSQLNSKERVQYINKVCDLMGLNPLTRPFEFMTFQGKMIMYAKKDATDQLRKIHSVSIEITDKQIIEGVLFITVLARDKTGRSDSDIGAISVGNLKGDSLANATMKALTKAKRRVTLSICGLGILDESEIETMEYKEFDPDQPLTDIEKKRISETDARLQENLLKKADSEEIKIVISEIRGMMGVISHDIKDIQERGKLMFNLLGVRSFSDLEKKSLDELNSRLKSLVAYNDELKLKNKTQEERPSLKLENN